MVIYPGYSTKGIVISVEDPSNTNKIQVRVPEVHGPPLDKVSSERLPSSFTTSLVKDEEIPWCKCQLDSSSVTADNYYGTGDIVYATFPTGNPSYIVVTGICVKIAPPGGDSLFGLYCAGVPDYETAYLEGSACYKSGRTIDVKGIMFHSLGCSGPNTPYPDRQASAFYDSDNVAPHAFTGSETSVITLPLFEESGKAMRGWHGADGPNGSVNDTHIGVEMCEPDCLSYISGSAQFTVSNKSKAVSFVESSTRQMVVLFAHICLFHGLDPLGKTKCGSAEVPVIMSHKEGNSYGVASNHGDPEHLWSGLGIKYSMDQFRKDVNDQMEVIRTSSNMIYPSELVNPNNGFAHPIPTAGIYFRRGFTSSHKGVDLTGNCRGLPVYACYDGVVDTVVSSFTKDGSLVGYSGSDSWGNRVRIKHALNGRVIYSHYCHLSATHVKVGDKVLGASRGGTSIGKVGSTGRSTGPHLHFEIYDPDRVDPLNYIPQLKTTITEEMLRTSANLASLSGLHKDGESGTIGKAKGDIATKIVNRIVSKGYNLAAALGVIANMLYESGFDPGAVGDSGTSFGLCQWHDNRGSNMKNFVGSDWSSDVEGQVDFLFKELDGSYTSVRNHLKGVSNSVSGARSAANYFVRKFEIPADIEGNSKRRQNTAELAWNLVNGKGG